MKKKKENHKISGQGLNFYWPSILNTVSDFQLLTALLFIPYNVGNFSVFHIEDRTRVKKPKLDLTLTFNLILVSYLHLS